MLGSLMAAADPCWAQADGSEPMVAAVETKGLQRLLWLAPGDPELSNRVRGQLIDTAWQVIDQGPAPKHTPGDREAQLSFAFKQARAAEAAAVAWVQEGAEHITVLVLDVARSRLSAREIPRPSADMSQQSAAFETAALIVRSTLLSIESGSVVGEAVAEPIPVAATARRERQPATATTATAAPRHNPDPESGLEFWGRVGAQVNVNVGTLSAGPTLGAGISQGGFRLGLEAHWLLPRDQRTSFQEAGAEQEVRLSWWRIGAVITAEHEWHFSRHWAGFFGVQPGLTLLNRATRSSPAVTPSSGETHVLPSLGVALGLAGPSLWDTLTPELILGAQFFARVPELAVGPAPEAELEAQFSRFEPWLALAVRFP